MSVAVRIEGEAFSDERYEDLAQFAGLVDSDHARGKMARLWRQCTIEQSHVLPVAIVVRVLGDNGVSALVEARLGEVVDAGVRIRGIESSEWTTYAIEATGQDLVKIGRTVDVDRRISALQVGSPHELRLLGSVPGDIEREAHRQLDLISARVRGEWFRLHKHTRGTLFSLGFIEEP